LLIGKKPKENQKEENQKGTDLFPESRTREPRKYAAGLFNVSEVNVFQSFS
jgi:hypothetical protein